MLKEIYNFLPCDDRIASAGQPTESQLAEVAQAGYQVVINLALSTSDNALPDEGSLVTALGMTYIHIPVIWEEPRAVDLESFFAAMEAHREQRIFLHCAANMRASAFMALYRAIRLGWPLSAAMQAVYEIWQPNETWQAFIDQMLTTNQRRSQSQ
jgi:uncharacterized protein (TIGR01244 family)